MDIYLTQWGQNSYLNLIYKKRIFTNNEYRNLIRPDTLKLKNYPNDPAFQNSSFFHPAAFNNGVQIADGYKMKWGQLGSGKNELRVLVAIINGNAYICEGYEKTSVQGEQRKLAKFQAHIKKIKNGQWKSAGELK